MGVLFPNHVVRTAARARPIGRDAHGHPVVTEEPVWSEPRPGSIKERPGFDPNRGQEWSIRLDPAHWPLKDDDLVMDETGRVLVLKDVTLNTIEYPGTELLWHVHGTGVLQIPEVP